MPSSYLRYAVDFDGHGRRDIWNSKPDVLASIANYLARSGWRRGEPWGQPVRCRRVSTGSAPGARTAGRSANGCGSASAGRMARRSRPPRRLAAVSCRTGRDGEAFMVYAQFRRDPPLQPFRLLRARGRAARGCHRRVKAGAALCCWRLLLRRPASEPPPANPHYVLGAPYQAGGVWYYPRASYRAVRDRARNGLRRRPRGADRPTGRSSIRRARGRAPDPATARDRAADQSGERPAGAGPDQRPRPGAPHRLLAVTRRTAELLRFPPTGGARAARGIAGRKPCGGRSGAGRAEAGADGGPARRRAAERSAAARRRRGRPPRCARIAQARRRSPRPRRRSAAGDA